MDILWSDLIAYIYAVIEAPMAESTSYFFFFVPYRKPSRILTQAKHKARKIISHYNAVMWEHSKWDKLLIFATAPLLSSAMGISNRPSLRSWFSSGALRARRAPTPTECMFEMKCMSILDRWCWRRHKNSVSDTVRRARYNDGTSHDRAWSWEARESCVWRYQ